jgi:hypothetical protein
MSICGFCDPRAVARAILERPDLATLPIQDPGLSLRGSEEPCAPFAVPVGLVPEELRPGDRARVFDDLGRGPHYAGHAAHQLVVVELEQFGLVALLWLVVVRHLWRSSR